MLVTTSAHIFGHELSARSMQPHRRLITLLSVQLRVSPLSSLNLSMAGSVGQDSRSFSHLCWGAGSLFPQPSVNITYAPMAISACNFVGDIQVEMLRIRFLSV